MRIVHAADLHIDSPMRGLARYDGAPSEAMRGATRRALENLITFCLEERVDVLLLAGDLFDDDWKDYSTGLFFNGQMSRLREIGTRVIVVRGNHDAANVVTKSLRLPDHVRQLSQAAPETVVFDDLGLAVHGQSFATRAVTLDLARAYPMAIDGALNIGLLHTSADGREGHAPYAPTSIETMRSRGYHYWALGHVHTREVLSTDPWIVFPGNLQGRHARETGEKGATLIMAENGQIVSVEALVLDDARWASIRVELGENDNEDDAFDRVRSALERERENAGSRTIAARVTIGGRTPAHEALQESATKTANEIRAIGNEIGGVWVEKVIVSVDAPIDFDAIAKRDDGAGAFVRALRELQTSGDESVVALGRSLLELEEKLPSELRRDGALALTDPKTLRRLLADVERTLLPRLLARERP